MLNSEKRTPGKGNISNLQKLRPSSIVDDGVGEGILLAEVRRQRF